MLFILKTSVKCAQFKEVVIKLTKCINKLMTSHKEFINLIDDLTALHTNELNISFDCESDHLTHFMKIGNPSMSNQIRRFISLTFDKTCIYNITCFRSNIRDSDVVIFIDLEIGRRNIAYWENHASIVLTGDCGLLIDIHELTRAIHRWVDTYSPSKISFYISETTN